MNRARGGKMSVLVFGLLVLGGLAQPAHAGPLTLMVGVEGSIDVHQQRLLAAGSASPRCYSVARICVADFETEAHLLQAMRTHAARSDVRWVERDTRMVVSQQALTDDHAGTSDCPDLWELPSIGLEAAFDLGFRGTTAPVVAIQDTGFLESHQDFGAVSGRFDYGDIDTTPEVSWSSGIPHHGTFIAGVINGVSDNNHGRAGVLPEGRLNLQKIADSSGALYFSYAVSAMADLADGDLGVRVLNYSIGGSSTTTAFDDAVAALGTADILLVAAAANCSVADCWDADNDAYPIYPASNSGDHVLAVAGSTRDGSFNSYSHYGEASVDLAAPGVDICSLGVNSNTETLTAGGTSYATPIVAAAAALVFEAHPSLTAVEVARVVRASAAEHPDLTDRVRSGGNLDIEAALKTAVPRLDALTDSLLLDGATPVGIDWTNAGAEGTAYVVLTHPAELGIRLGADAPSDWSATSFAPGDLVVLPDAEDHTATGYGTVLSGPMPEHATRTLSTIWGASADGSGDVTVRLVASSEGADYLNAPYREGLADETGFLAYSSTVTYTAVEPVDDTGTPVDTGESGGSGSGSDDGGPSDVDTSLPDDAEDAASEESGGKDTSGCSVAGGSLVASWWVGLVVMARRRHVGTPAAVRESRA